MSLVFVGLNVYGPCGNMNISIQIVRYFICILYTKCMQILTKFRDEHRIYSKFYLDSQTAFTFEILFRFFSLRSIFESKKMCFF